MLGLLAAATAGISALHGIGVAALGAWQTWAILLATTWLSVRPMDVEVASVGVDWLQFGRPRRWYRRREARRGVLLYQLITVRVHLAGEEPRLTVSDSHGNSVECDLMDAQSDRRGWDLVYNGIVHSVAAGAVITPTTADVLGLRDHPALDLSDVPPSAPGIRGANPARNDRDRI